MYGIIWNTVFIRQEIASVTQFYQLNNRIPAKKMKQLIQ